MMKRKLLFIATVLGILVIVYLQFGLPAVANNVTTVGNSDGYTANLTVTVNKICILSREKLAKKLIQKTIANDFHNILLSYDMLGYPNELTITVYTNSLGKYRNAPALKIRYYQDPPYSYNIKDHPEMFTMKIE